MNFFTVFIDFYFKLKLPYKKISSTLINSLILYTFYIKLIRFYDEINASLDKDRFKICLFCKIVTQQNETAKFIDFRKDAL